MVAGEASGDNLGGPLIRALAARTDGARFYGVAGPAMTDAGCEQWYPSDTLAVMGLAEILQHLPRLVRFKRDLLRRFSAARPDAFIGIDSPEFNLRMARALRERGVATVQYVSPQVWAWRRGRVRTIAEAVDLVLCVLPFESDPVAARAALGLPAGGEFVAVLPGSRGGEVSRLGPPFAATVAWLAKRRPGLGFVAPMANAAVRSVFEQALRDHAPGVQVQLVDGRALDAVAASDAVLLASGTATLETALVKRPMVVAYRVAPLTGWLLREMKLVKTEFFSIPNLLAGRQLVPEYFQEQVRAEVLGPAMLEQLERPDRGALVDAFGEIHQVLRRDASARAADAVLELLSRRRAPR